MSSTRREFVRKATFGAAGLAVGPVLASDQAAAATASDRAPRDFSGERIAFSAGSFYRPYRSRSAGEPIVATWVQIDLGSSHPIENVKLYPSYSGGFPVRFRIECADDVDFTAKVVLADRTRRDYPSPESSVLQFPQRRVQARYVRLTATRLRTERERSFVFALAKMEVISGGIDIALHRPVDVDETLGNPTEAQQLTRARRPQGEGVVTDRPGNVTDPTEWEPVADQAASPSTGVQVQEGLFRTALQQNTDYLLAANTVEDLLRPFRQRAGQKVLPPTHVLHPVWDEGLPGSSAGRFLMGAAQSLHWIDHPELRQRMMDIVDGIEACRQPNGYIMAYPEDTFFVAERGAYTRSWVTHGLIEAGHAGNAKAFELLRGYYDWYNGMPHLSQALRRCGFGPQGMVANTRVYFSPVGRPKDLQVLQRYFQENYWLDDLAARRVDALWQYPYDRPHGYLITFLEAYLDLYRATGDRRYLAAVQGGWELFRQHWQQTGGSISLIEWISCPPDANSLQEHSGETCSSAFWVLLNQRLHLLNPDKEIYICEIEKSIYNVLLANQDGTRGIRYHARLVNQKSHGTCINTCCEGQGTRLLAGLPQFIYSVAPDGIYVNLFEPSTIDWQQGQTPMQLQMSTRFPYEGAVEIAIQSAAPVQTKIRIRIPSWAAGVMDILVNNRRVVSGVPGSFVMLDRRWASGDKIRFDLPLAFRLTKYTGVDQIQGKERYALEYGPILMAALNAADAKLTLRQAASPMELLERLRPVRERPLHFILSDPLAVLFSESETEFAPYFEIGSESFSCFPVVEAKDTLL